MAYIPLHKLKVYQLCCEYGQKSWKIYERLGWKLQKIIGDQWITSVDSIGANLAEGYGRYHYLDKIKFYYNSRGSLFESKYWLDLLFIRKIINQEEYTELVGVYNNIKFGLNGLINSVYKRKNKDNSE